MEKKEDWRIKEHMPKDEVSEKQNIGNLSDESSFILKCVRCGESKDLSFIAHRNKDKCITGFVVICQTCFPIIGNTEKKIRISSK